MKPLLPFTSGSVFFDATIGPIRLKHPEGLAVAPDGAIWCGGEGGEIYRIEPDGSAIEQIATTGGFTLGMAFDGQGHLYTCDLAHAAVFRLDVKTRALKKFATGSPEGIFRIPNYPVVDPARNCLYISDSYSRTKPGPGIWRLDLDTGAGRLWLDQPLTFANGMALSLDRKSLFVVETFAHRVSRIEINDDGSAGKSTVAIEGVDRLPDGLAFDVEGNLYISCYEPSRIYRATPDGRLELLFDDPDAHLLCHPTNCAFRGTDLFTSNLGRWHITQVKVGIIGAPLL